MNAPQPATQDKIILLAILLLFMGIIVCFDLKHIPDGADWAQRAYDNIQGALLMLLTGRAVTARRSDSNDGGNNATTTNGGGNGATAPSASGSSLSQASEGASAGSTQHL